MFRLDEFFRVMDEVDLPASPAYPKGERAMVRVLSDVEIQSRSEYVISEQLKVSDQLRDANSAFYILKIAPLDAASDEVLIETLAEVYRVNLMRDSGEMFRLDFYPYPDKATPEEKIETLRRQEIHEREVYAARLKYVADGERAYREKLAGLNHDILLVNAKTAASQVYIFKAQVDAELWFTIAHAYSTLDGKQRWTLEQVKNLPGRVLNLLIKKYREVDAVDPWELTKSLATGNTGGMESSNQERGADQPAPGA